MKESCKTQPKSSLSGKILPVCFAAHCTDFTRWKVLRWQETCIGPPRYLQWLVQSGCHLLNDSVTAFCTESSMSSSQRLIAGLPVSHTCSPARPRAPRGQGLFRLYSPIFPPSQMHAVGFAHAQFLLRLEARGKTMGSGFGVSGREPAGSGQGEDHVASRCLSLAHICQLIWILAST